MTAEARRSQVESLNFSRHPPQFAQVCDAGWNCHDR
jgi:hypothetical protein